MLLGFDLYCGADSTADPPALAKAEILFEKWDGSNWVSAGSKYSLEFPNGGTPQLTRFTSGGAAEVIPVPTGLYTHPIDEDEFQTAYSGTLDDFYDAHNFRISITTVSDYRDVPIPVRQFWDSYVRLFGCKYKIKATRSLRDSKLYRTGYGIATIWGNGYVDRGIDVIRLMAWKYMGLSPFDVRIAPTANKLVAGAITRQTKIRDVMRASLVGMQSALRFNPDKTMDELNLGNSDDVHAVTLRDVMLVDEQFSAVYGRSSNDDLYSKITLKFRMHPETEDFLG
jgi:hypothetical protein